MFLRKRRKKRSIKIGNRICFKNKELFGFVFFAIFSSPTSKRHERVFACLACCFLHSLSYAVHEAMCYSAAPTEMTFATVTRFKD